MRYIILILFVASFGFASCEKCQECNYHWTYSENDTTISAWEFSDKRCGNNNEMTEMKEEWELDAAQLENKLEKDNNKSNIEVTKVVCTEV